MAKAIHMMIRVLDEARSVAFYEKALGLQIADRYEFDSFTLVYLSNAKTPFELELTINHGRKEPSIWARATGMSPSRSTISTPNTRTWRLQASRSTRSRSLIAKGR
jgi:catechol 2,3-dioxygenase-like lactoylglutathione lyase family enzyme